MNKRVNAWKCFHLLFWDSHKKKKYMQGTQYDFFLKKEENKHTEKFKFNTNVL